MLKILSIVVIGVGFVYFLSLLFPTVPQSKIDNKYNPVSETTYTSSSPSPYPTVNAVPYLTDSFVKRQFDPTSKFITGWGRDATPSANYPAEIVSKNALIGMKCTGEFLGTETSDFATVIKDQRYMIKSGDKIFDDVLSKIKADIGDDNIYSFSYCLTESGGMMIHYYLGGKDRNKEIALPDNFLFVKNSGEIQKVAINIGPAYYFKCRSPLQLTDESTLYFKCHGGDTTSYDSIYKIDFNKKTSTLILECSQSEGDTNIQPNPPLICK